MNRAAPEPGRLAGPLMELMGRAGEAILGVYRDERQGYEYTLKEDKSPLTIADRASNAIILQGLEALTPSFPVVSEESSAVPFAIRKNWTSFWCVDPLDGTKEFLERNGEFCINIGLIDEGKPVFGIIYIPVSGVFYFGCRETGSWKVVNGHTPVRVYADNGAKEWIVVGSRSHKSKAEDETAAHPKVVKRIVAGSAIKFCLIAEGSAHLYHRHGPTMEWDTAAGHAILESSGGRLATLSGGPLIYNKESLLNGSFICGIEEAITI